MATAKRPVGRPSNKPSNVSQKDWTSWRRALARGVPDTPDNMALFLQAESLRKQLKRKARIDVNDLLPDDTDSNPEGLTLDDVAERHEEDA